MRSGHFAKNAANGDESDGLGLTDTAEIRLLTSAGDTSAARALTGSKPRDTPAWTGLLVGLMACTVLVYVVDIVLQPLPSSISELFQKFASSAIFFGAAALCALKGRAIRAERLPWWSLALAMALWGAGAAYYAAVLWETVEIPYPSPADGFWIVFYAPACAALYLLLRRRAAAVKRGVWLDALVGGLGVGSAAAAVAFGIILGNTGGTTLATITNLAYPVGDLALLALVVSAMTVTGWKAAGAWRWIAAAFAIFVVADSIYLVQVATETYAAGSLVDLGWPLAALLVGLAAWRPETREAVGGRAGATNVVPAVCGLGALALLVIDHYVSLNPLALGLAAASIVVILIRLYLTLLDNGRLLATSRSEALTDPLTGLGNRRQLSADLALHLADLGPDQPLLLTLYDLDGFKQYNDSFGHVAGDQLLERLGARLREAVAGRGTAYRMGGDEFCTIWREVAGGDGPITALEAAAALSEAGEAFSISCSYGSVLLPDEAADRSGALRLADHRMYVRKRSGRASAGRQSADVLLQALTERDSELGFHLGGVAELACATAFRLGLGEEDVEATRQVALLHDVGKVAIPDEILSKPGTLDEAEWAFMKRHTLIGERIIQAAPALAPIARLVRSTHERFDGGGYPDGLMGSEIPLIARIVSVCDAYDAMITTRAYRTARARPEAVAELHSHSGTQFDPQVVEAFVSSLEALGDEQVESLLRRDARLGAVALQALQAHDRQRLSTT